MAEGSPLAAIMASFRCRCSASCRRPTPDALLNDGAYVSSSSCTQQVEVLDTAKEGAGGGDQRIAVPIGSHERRFDVCLVHHDVMHLHMPPRYKNIYELPRRVIAIKNRLKGRCLCDGFPREVNFGGPMQLLPRGSPALAFGSPASGSKRPLGRASFDGAPLSQGSAWAACRAIEAPEVARSDLLLVHSEDHVAAVEKACALAVSQGAAIHTIAQPEAVGSSSDSLRGKKRPRIAEEAVQPLGADDADCDTYYSPDSLAAFRRAAGGAVCAVRELFEIDANTGRAVRPSCVGAAFAIVRPPGHHCCDAPAGFCFFNNTAVAAAHARAVLGLSRVAIVDWDYHHGDGTQQVFYRDPNVLTISLHVAMASDGLAFPCKKEMGVEYSGLGLGRGYNINIPWPHDCVGAEEYDDAFTTVVLPALEGFNPELILVASGFDAVAGDKLAGTRLQARDFHSLTKRLLGLGRPLALVLEGGYSTHLLAEASLNVVHALLQQPPPPLEKGFWPVGPKTADGAGQDIEAQRILDAVRRRLNLLPPWCGMRRPCGEGYFLECCQPGASGASAAAASELTKCIDKLVDALASCVEDLS